MNHSKELMEAAMQLCYSNNSPFHKVEPGRSPTAESVADFIAPHCQTELRIAKQQRDLLLEALKRCRAAAEDNNRLPSARLELVRDYATPLIIAAEGGAHE